MTIYERATEIFKMTGTEAVTSARSSGQNVIECLILIVNMKQAQKKILFYDQYPTDYYRTEGKKKLEDKIKECETQLEKFKQMTYENN